MDESSQVEKERAVKYIRQETTDLYNRLHSIAEDAVFVSRIIQSYPEFPVYPNLRCGAWYVDPEIAQAEPIYFKSTDGHFGQWGFNLRRLNLHLLHAVSRSSGIIIVDSTRRGKRLPDALSKTIPIWCAVVNLACAKTSSTSTYADQILYTPPGAVSRSEHAQIEACLAEWAAELSSSEFSMPHLEKPLRPIWITPATPTLPDLDAVEFFPVVCVSASKLVTDGIEHRSAGFAYVQGSGDDHESWSRGLAPSLYWEKRAQLLSSSRSELPDLVASLVALSARNIRSDTGKPVAVRRVNSRIAIGKIPFTASELTEHTTAYVIIIRGTLPFPLAPSDDIFLLELPTGKKGQHAFLAVVLPRSMEFIKYHLQRDENVVILCEDGKDVSVGVAVAALSLYFNDHGACTVDTGLVGAQTKKTIHKRLQWILADNSQANPSRTTLKRVNEYLMSPPRARSSTINSTKGNEFQEGRNRNSTPDTVLYNKT